MTAYAWSRDGDLVFADRNRIRRTDPKGVTSLIAEIEGKVLEPKIWNATDTPSGGIERQICLGAIGASVTGLIRLRVGNGPVGNGARSLARARYTIQIDENSSFPSPLILQQATTGSQFNASALPTLTMWWRIRANDTAGNAGSWSSSRRFEVKK